MEGKKVIVDDFVIYLPRGFDSSSSSSSSSSSWPINVPR